MDVGELLTARFTKAVRKSFDPCPLIGPKWFRYRGDAVPPYFQFTGAKSLAKATSSTPERVAQRIVRNLDMDGIGAEVEITGDSRISVKFRKLPDVS